MASTTADIVIAEQGDALQLAAHEVKRYVYLRTDELLSICESPSDGNAIVIDIDPSLDEQAYRLRTTETENRRELRITGGSEVATLYGAYEYAEHLGFRFHMHGDVIPDGKVDFKIPVLDEFHEPLFEHRGVQPFHDFPEGPDWWEEDDYHAYLSQLAKMRMNFIGLHTYPQHGTGPEPTVWIGPEEEYKDDGTVVNSYPSTYMNSLRQDRSEIGGEENAPPWWGYVPTPTSEYSVGADLLFEIDNYGSEVMNETIYDELTPEQSNEIFNDTADMLDSAFSHGERLGIERCLGTETPLDIPDETADRIEQRGPDPNDSETQRKVYEGVFDRLDRAYGTDYYWLWTPEAWTWQAASTDHIEATTEDISIALEALSDLDEPFPLGTCGWVLGPQRDRTIFDKQLPDDGPMACINREVGFDWIDTGFAEIEDRPKWAIPWIEDDPAQIIPQLWAGRMRRDAGDAHAYGCTGLLGIHWRTKILAPNRDALAKAAWDDQPWNPDFGERIEVQPRTEDVYHEGEAISISDHAIEGTDEVPIYQTYRHGMRAYQADIPNGTYDITLKLIEPEHDEKGRRVFDVEAQNEEGIEKLDVYEEVGTKHALERTIEEVDVTNGTLTISFLGHHYPVICGIVIDGMTTGSNQIEPERYTRKINCGGDAWKDYEADFEPASDQNRKERQRDLPAEDYYLKWASDWFGEAVAEEAAAIFTRLDGGEGQYDDLSAETNLPRPSTWRDGPGGIIRNEEPWEEVKEAYDFVEEFASLSERVSGDGNRRRFKYWLDNFRYLRAVGHVGCLRGNLDRIVDEIEETDDTVERERIVEEEALPNRIELARVWEQMMTLLLQTVSTPGEMGNVANLEQHVRRSNDFLDEYDERFKAILSKSLPDEVELHSDYRGSARLIVPTKRTHIDIDEELSVKIIVLDNERPSELTLSWRPLGTDESFKTIEADHDARAVYWATLPPAPEEGIEYYVEATTAASENLVWPPTAPQTNQTLVSFSWD